VTVLPKFLREQKPVAAIVAPPGNTIPRFHFWKCRRCKRLVRVGDGIPEKEYCPECVDLLGCDS